jgi:hypothetical protein
VRCHFHEAFHLEKWLSLIRITYPSTFRPSQTCFDDRIGSHRSLVSSFPTCHHHNNNVKHQPSPFDPIHGLRRLATTTTATTTTTTTTQTTKRHPQTLLWNGTLQTQIIGRIHVYFGNKSEVLFWFFGFPPHGTNPPTPFAFRTQSSKTTHDGTSKPSKIF